LVEDPSSEARRTKTDSLLPFPKASLQGFSLSESTSVAQGSGLAIFEERDPYCFMQRAGQGGKLSREI